MKKAMKVATFLIILSAALLFSFPSWSYQEEKVSGGGAVKGKVVYNGTVPMRKIVPTKDTEVCGGVHDIPLIVVGGDKGVKDAVVYLKDVQKGKAWQKATAREPVLDNNKCRFEPRVQVVPLGSKIEILNSDPVLHNTHGFLDKKTIFNVAMPLQGMKVKKPLRKAGLLRIDCDSHGWMRGWIYVADNPYYALTAADGTFEISDIPPGDYNMVVWQEETGAVEKQITVKSKETVTLNIELKK